MGSMDTTKLREMLRATHGRFFRVQFIKRATGETRQMVARLGVQKSLTGEGLKFNPANRDLMVAWDTGKKNYRMINLRGLTSFKCGAMEWRAA
jgi:hypothetical protein